MSKKRKYNSDTRQEQAKITKQRVLAAAQKLFSTKGFEKTTIGKVAHSADVAPPTVYALFKSKEGLLRELVHTTLFGVHYQELVDKSLAHGDPVESLKMAASISRVIYEAKTSKIGFIKGASNLFPALKKMEEEAERLRYERQEFVVQRLKEKSLLKKGIGPTDARDILWTLTSQEVYLLFVCGRKWSPEKYENWLSKFLQFSLLG